MDKINKTEAEWKKELSPEQFDVLRREKTERAFSGKFYDLKDSGSYFCAGCGQLLFGSDSKFDSGTGWPSFDKPADLEAVESKSDNKFFMRRTEVHCRRCGGHLGHVFDDGPKQLPTGEPGTGKRYCINSVALDFKPDK